MPARYNWSSATARHERRYRRAATITEQLLQELESVPAGGDNDEARLAWRAFVALLLGHVQFHGLKDPIAANGPYRLVLDSQPSDTLRELAEQGLEACEQTASEPPPGGTGPRGL